MWPRKAYTCIDSPVPEQRREASFVVHGRDLAAVAYVDARTAELSSSAYHGLASASADSEQQEEMRRALDLVLSSGEAPPAVNYDGPEAFAAALRQRRYRGALALVEPSLYLNADGSPVGVSFGVLNRRVGAGHGDRICVGAATDRRRYTVELAQDHAVIVHWQRFRMASMADMFGRFPGADHAPFGWIKVSCVLWADGRSEAHYAASFFPSCWFYRDWSRCHRRDMAVATVAELGCVLAPTAELASGTTFAAHDTSSGYVHALERRP
jgi:hypothetical protein